MSTVRRGGARLRWRLLLAGLAVLLGGATLFAGTPTRDGGGAAARTTVGFPAGDADQVSAHRSLSFLDWPPGGSGEDAEPARPLTVPGSESDGASSGRSRARVEPGPVPGALATGPEPPTVPPSPDGADDVLRAESYDVGPAAVTRPAMRSAEGFDVAGGSAESGTGELVTYTVELEPAVGDDLLVVTAAVEEALHDPRSWGRDHLLRRVEDPAEADVRLVLATPTTVDRLCGEAGLRTEGRYSCWNGTFAALNAMRWQNGAADFSDLTTYRRYLINHEFGHGLGHGHVDCPAPGALAPVMMQQTITTGACDANGWPYPDAPVD